MPCCTRATTRPRPTTCPACGRGDHRDPGHHRGQRSLGLRRHHARGVRAGGAWKLNGHKSFVIDGHVAGLLVVAARAPKGVTPLRREPATPRADADLAQTMDQTRKQARIEFADTPATLIGDEGGAGPAVADARPGGHRPGRRAGRRGAARARHVGRYAKTRVQFGRPDRSFQAIKHKCADMLFEVESAKSAAYYAGWAAAEDSDEFPVVASLAKSYCSEAYFHAAADNIQIHGGSASPGSTPPTCTSSGRRRRSFSSATRPTTANCWHSASASDSRRLTRGSVPGCGPAGRGRPARRPDPVAAAISPRAARSIRRAVPSIPTESGGRRVRDQPPP